MLFTARSSVLFMYYILFILLITFNHSIQEENLHGKFNDIKSVCNESVWSCTPTCRIQFEGRTGKCQKPKDETCFGSSITYKFVNDFASKSLIDSYGILSQYPDCWQYMKPLLCSIAYRPCSIRSYFYDGINSSDNNIMESWQVFQQKNCFIAKEKCPTVVKENLWPDFLKCDDFVKPDVHITDNSLANYKRYLFVNNTLCKSPYNGLSNEESTQNNNCMWPLVRKNISKNIFVKGSPIVDTCFLPCKNSLFSDNVVYSVFQLSVGIFTGFVLVVSIVLFIYIVKYTKVFQSSYIMFLVVAFFFTNILYFFVYFLSSISSIGSKISCLDGGSIRKSSSYLMSNSFDSCLFQGILLQVILNSSYLTLVFIIFCHYAHPKFCFNHYILLGSKSEYTLNSRIPSKVLFLVTNLIVSIILCSFIIFSNSISSSGIFQICNVGSLSFKSALNMYYPMIILNIVSIGIPIVIMVRRSLSMRMIEKNEAEKKHRPLFGNMGAVSSWISDNIIYQQRRNNDRELGSMDTLNFNDLVFWKIDDKWMIVIIVTMILSCLISMSLHIKIGYNNLYEENEIKKFQSCVLNKNIVEGQLTQNQSNFLNYISNSDDPLLRKKELLNQPTNFFNNCELPSIDHTLSIHFIIYLLLIPAPFYILLVSSIVGIFNEKYGLNGLKEGKDECERKIIKNIENEKISSAMEMDTCEESELLSPSEQLGNLYPKTQMYTNNINYNLNDRDRYFYERDFRYITTFRKVTDKVGTNAENNCNDKNNEPEKVGSSTSENTIPSDLKDTIERSNDTDVGKGTDTNMDESCFYSQNSYKTKATFATTGFDSSLTDEEKLSVIQEMYNNHYNMYYRENSSTIVTGDELNLQILPEMETMGVDSPFNYDYNSLDKSVVFYPLYKSQVLVIDKELFHPGYTPSQIMFILWLQYEALEPEKRETFIKPDIPLFINYEGRDIWVEPPQAYNDDRIERSEYDIFITPDNPATNPFHYAFKCPTFLDRQKAQFNPVQLCFFIHDRPEIFSRHYPKDISDPKNHYEMVRFYFPNNRLYVAYDDIEQLDFVLSNAKSLCESKISNESLSPFGCNYHLLFHFLESCHVFYEYCPKYNGHISEYEVDPHTRWLYFKSRLYDHLKEFFVDVEGFSIESDFDTPVDPEYKLFVKRKRWYSAVKNDPTLLFDLKIENTYQAFIHGHDISILPNALDILISDSDPFKSDIIMRVCQKFWSLESQYQFFKDSGKDPCENQFIRVFNALETFIPKAVVARNSLLKKFFNEVDQMRRSGPGGHLFDDVLGIGNNYFKHEYEVPYDPVMYLDGRHDLDYNGEDDQNDEEEREFFFPDDEEYEEEVEEEEELEIESDSEHEADDGFESGANTDNDD
ncbi:Frizzled domain-containing protein [Strongyloides ratti]|uniref:Frizzled domain-containing protein n=1 Tax=Strongyloides ratti TaxID=34506 RepID=A0A090L091_STRRB|nr:Frizzled domain-containing protein [Strongyloides ratti]CEF63101.1 Frizzled domain-containing protein [Strongyloides ratti]